MYALILKKIKDMPNFKSWTDSFLEISVLDVPGPKKKQQRIMKND